jgi:hypothetical protein
VLKYTSRPELVAQKLWSGAVLGKQAAALFFNLKLLFIGIN